MRTPRVAQNWTFSLKQPTELTITQGTIPGVASAVRRGADLRLCMTSDRYEETTYAPTA